MLVMKKVTMDTAHHVNHSAAEIKKTPLASTMKRISASKFLLLLMAPGLIYYIVLRYGPMFGLIMAFEDYNYYKGFFGSQFVGLKYFRMFMSDPRFFRIFSNTVIVGFFNVVFVLPVAGAFAIFLNEIRNATEKLKKKALDYIVVNNPLSKCSGFGSETNRVVILDAGGGRVELPLISKDELADRLLEQVSGKPGK